MIVDARGKELKARDTCQMKRGSRRTGHFAERELGMFPNRLFLAPCLRACFRTMADAKRLKTTKVREVTYQAHYVHASCR